MSKETGKSLLVVGAAAGTAKWMCEHLLSKLSWNSVTLADTSPSILTTDCGFVSPVRSVQLEDTILTHDLANQLGLADPELVVVVGVPVDTIEGVAKWLLPTLSSGAQLIDLGHDRLGAKAAYESIDANRQIVGVHALFAAASTSLEGQTLTICLDENTDAPQWLIDSIVAEGGAINFLTPHRHDEIMAYVQAASHQALLTFASVISNSGLDLERDMWANRTPLFELLMGLTSRLLTPEHQPITSVMQFGETKQTVSEMFVKANSDFATVLGQGAKALSSHIDSIREPFSSALITKSLQVATLASSAVQSTRSEISRHHTAGTLVGVRAISNPLKLRVGKIVSVSATSFVLNDMLVGPIPHAALVSDDIARSNAKRIGITGKAKRVEFTLGKVLISSQSDLESELNQVLATFSRGTKVLVPESISKDSVLNVIGSIEGVCAVELLTEEVKLGQREIVIKFSARIDQDGEVIEQRIQNRIDEVFLWPEGIVLGVKSAKSVGFLGPIGTFSYSAATQLGSLLALEDTNVIDCESFDILLSKIVSGEIDLGVVPIVNSSSGLVDLAAQAFLDAPSNISAFGVVDLVVRFDAYTPNGRAITPGATVFTHPQVVRQCSQFIAANGLKIHECASTIEACRLVAASGTGVAIANVGLDRGLGLAPARSGVGNLSGVVTRFLAVARTDSILAPERPQATLRNVWVAKTPTPFVGRTNARFDETIVGPSGLVLVVSTSTEEVPADANLRFLGCLPWSPRTPLVVVS